MHAGLTRIGARYASFGTDGGSNAIRDIDGRMTAFMDLHHWDAMIVRPDFYIYGGIADCSAMPGLAKDLLTDLKNAGLKALGELETVV